MSRRRLGAVLSGVALLMSLSACGGSKSHHPSSSKRHETAADVAHLQSADCDLWRVMPRADRRHLLTNLRSFFGARVDEASTAGQRGTTLDDKRAEHVLNSYCRLSFAGRFKLYKIYGRSAAFTTVG